MTKVNSGAELPGLDDVPCLRDGVRNEVMLLVTNYRGVGLVQMVRGGHWLPPQGGIELGQTIRDAAMYELETETGISHVAVENMVGLMWCDNVLPRSRIEGRDLKYHTKAFVGLCVKVSALKPTLMITDKNIQQFKAVYDPYELQRLMSPDLEQKAVRPEKYHICCELFSQAMRHQFLDQKFEHAFAQSAVA